MRAGEALMDGPLNPHDILRVLGMKRLQEYLVNEIQEVYRLQGVNINDKHIEVIVRQMLRWVKIKEVGDTEFLLEEQVDRFRFQDENERVTGKTARWHRPNRCCWVSPRLRFRPTRFISAASFQETTRVLTEAAISGRVDYLRGLKENVIMGRLIPAGTGMEYYRNVKQQSGRRRATACGGSWRGSFAEAPNTAKNFGRDEVTGTSYLLSSPFPEEPFGVGARISRACRV